ncbi:ABC transporter substrate-binding protein [Clostridium tarantellae]|uniref:ABC transporter substrate-binding protein n=1 Tax=Clostridium tarantellae TaxID=39493 RepID=A0A6I1MKU7_9CLOT|nr:ABC transporter substrate-binding protein [Clostridium tarantellae]MPQ43068.1 ABC transporter substrate-binding protein [Clostridium tarantellae]
MKKILNKKIKITLLMILTIYGVCHISIFKIWSKKEYNFDNLKGKHLVAYVTLRDEEAKAIFELFKKETGCTYEYIKLPTEQAVTRILDEAKNPKADIYIGGTCDGYEILKFNDVLEKYKSFNVKNIPDKFKDSKGYWTGFEIEPLAIAINKDSWDKKFNKEHIQKPSSFNDLLNSIYKNSIILPNPITSGTGYTLLASLYQQLGEEEFIKFIKKIKVNTKAFTVSGFNAVQNVASGEYPITINFLGDQLIMEKSNVDLINVVPKNAGWNVNAVAKIKNRNNNKVASAFIDFCLSDYLKDKLNNFSTGLSTKNIKHYDYDIFQQYSFEKAAQNRNRVMELWNNN